MQLILYVVDKDKGRVKREGVSEESRDDNA